STSTRRVSTRSRPGLCSLDSSPTSRTSTESRSAPRTCTSAGSSDTSNAASGESKANQPPSSRTSEGPPRVPWRTSPRCADVTLGSNRTGFTASKPDMVKPGVAGRSMKSPAASVWGRWPSTARRQCPSSTAQKLRLLVTVWKPKVMLDFTLSLQPVIQFMTLLPAPCFEELVSTFADEVRNAFDRTATRVRSRVHFRQFQTFGNLSDYGHIQWAVFNSCSTEWSGLKCGEIFDLWSNLFMTRH